MVGRRRSATPEEGVPWGREVPQYRCAVCLVEVPCADTLASHLRGKDHMKRCKQVEERAKAGKDPTSWAAQRARRAREPTHGEREELEALRREKAELQREVGQATPHPCSVPRCRGTRGSW